LTKKKGLKDLNEAKDPFKKMTSVSSELSEFIKDKEIRYCLVYD
jgi:hypothetical protein